MGHGKIIYMKNIRLLALVALMLLPVAFAQSKMPDDMSRRVDALLAPENTQDLRKLLTDNQRAAWYGELESYVLKKARQMVVQNDLDHAKQICLTVIDINLDNQEAVNLYQSVNAAIVKRDSAAKKAAEAENLEVFKQQASEAKIKQDLSKTYKTVTNTSSGKKVYLDQDFNNHYSSTTWDVMLGLVNVKALVREEAFSVNYGLSLNGSLFYHGEDFTIGADIRGDATVLAFTGPQTVTWSGSGVMSAASNALNKYLVLRLGAFSAGYGFGVVSKEPEVFISPVLGAGFRDVRFGETGLLETGVDWYAGHLYTEGMIAAAGVHLGLTVILAEMQDFDIHVRMAVQDAFMLYSSGMTNDTKVTLAIGVGNYD